MNEECTINKEKINYFSYEFKEEDENKESPTNFEEVLKKYQQKNPQFKMKGVSTKDRIPSLGDWEQTLDSSSLLIFYGQPGILNIANPATLVNFFNNCKTKCVIALDRVNV